MIKDYNFKGHSEERSDEESFIKILRYAQNDLVFLL